MSTLQCWGRFPHRIVPPTPKNPFFPNQKPLRHRRHSSSPSTTIIKMAETSSVSRRPTCPSCSKPACLCLCLCNRFQSPNGLENKVSVTILQHSIERKHPLNSARIAKLGLRNVSLFTVSDVNLDAQFVIRLLEPDSELNSGRIEMERSDFNTVLETKETKKREFEDICGFNSTRETMDSFKEKRSYLGSFGQSPINQTEVRKEPVIKVKIGKYGVVNDLDICSTLISQNGNLKGRDFDHFLASQIVVNILGNGFFVEKLQKRQLDRREDLEEFVEFEVVVPSGSVLLFPSDSAVSVDDLKAMNIKVKNLIVLDGTWAKARRMYKENPWLKLLLHLKLDLDEWSLYSEVRHQPEAGCLSTIESIVYTLKAVGDDLEGLDNLLDVFESMVADQRWCKDERLSKVSPG